MTPASFLLHFLLASQDENSCNIEVYDLKISVELIRERGHLRGGRG